MPRKAAPPRLAVLLLLLLDFLHLTCFHPLRVSKAPLFHLCYSQASRVAVSRLYDGLPVSNYQTFGKDNTAAAARLVELDLDLLHPRPDGKWAVVRSKKTDAMEQKPELSRKLFQCRNGYDHKARGYAERQSAWSDLGCLAHIWLAMRVGDGKVFELSGQFEHSDGCRAFRLTQQGRMPLAPAVFDLAVNELRSGASMQQVCERNAAVVDSKGYPGQRGDNARYYRWRIDSNDGKALHRARLRRMGIDATTSPEENLHHWLCGDLQSVKDSTFGYVPLTAQTERFELGISTPEMRDAAWAHGHQKQIILDGTFGVSTKKVIDERKRGIPVGFLLFSAPRSSAFTAGSYDAAILAQMLNAWKGFLETVGHGQSFLPRLATTDTDFKERLALRSVWSSIHLRICRFHFLKACGNKFGTCFKGVGSRKTRLPGADGATKELVRRLPQTLAALPDVAGAQAHVDELAGHITRGDASSGVKNGAATFIMYLRSYWLQPDLFESWSDGSRRAAAALLAVELDVIVSTTNHLESFNNVLKNRMLAPFKNGGGRLRLNLLVHLLIHRLLPTFFLSRRADDSAARHRAACFGLDREYAGKINAPQPDCAWNPSQGDPEPAEQRFSVTAVSPDRTTFRIVTLSSTVTPGIPAHLTETYDQTITFVEASTLAAATCTCPAYQRSRRVCTHLRAAQAYLAHCARQFPDLYRPPSFPSSAPEAAELDRRLITCATSTYDAPRPLPLNDVCILVEDSAALEEEDDDHPGAGAAESSDPSDPSDAESEADFEDTSTSWSAESDAELRARACGGGGVTTQVELQLQRELGAAQRALAAAAAVVVDAPALTSRMRAELDAFQVSLASYNIVVASAASRSSAAPDNLPSSSPSPSAQHIISTAPATASCSKRSFGADITNIRLPRRVDIAKLEPIGDEVGRKRPRQGNTQQY
ncbi:hypothetical protein JCM10450v2_006049 [Rhodotorula kratochvilovae]